MVQILVFLLRGLKLEEDALYLLLGDTLNTDVFHGVVNTLKLALQKLIPLEQLRDLGVAFLFLL